MATPKKIALIGNPNSGKTSLFNLLTGLNQRVGNYPGITVEKRQGDCSFKGNIVNLIDLPGTYSLSASNADEKIVQQILLNPDSDDFPDAILIVVDGTNLKRNLFLASQVIDLGLPCLLVVNMIDLVTKQGKQIDLVRLSDFLGVRVIGTSARGGEGLDILKQALHSEIVRPSKILYEDESELAVEFNLAPDRTPYYRFKLLNAIALENITHVTLTKEQITTKGYNALKQDLIEVGIRSNQIQESMSIFYTDSNSTINKTKKFDRIATHPLWGSLLFLSVFFILFQSIFTLASFPMEYIEIGLGYLGQLVGSNLPQGFLADFIQDGLFAGLAGVLVFIPQIVILFALIAILEDTGYLSRVAFMFDGLLKRFGMNGKSVVPLVGGFACAIPSIMAARSIEGKRDRLITIFITPLLSCSARLPVYVFLVSFIVPNEFVWGVLSLQGLFMLLLYLLGLLVGLVVAYVITLFIKEDKTNVFILELPNYKSPSLRNACVSALNKGKIFVLEAGKVILIASVILWFLSYFGPTEKNNQIEQTYAVLRSEIDANQLELDRQESAEKLENSYLGIIGHAIEPAIKPLGYDWKIGIAIISSFAAREVFVGTMSTIYSVENNELSGLKSIRFSYATAFSLLMFYVFALQCMSTLAIVKQETGNWKIPLLQFVIFTAIGYLSALCTYSLLA